MIMIHHLCALAVMGLCLQVDGLAVPQPTLVVGATGKVGRLVVRQLLESGKPVHALVRDFSKASEVLDSNPNLELFRGDLHNKDEIKAAMVGCVSVIAVSGTTRFSKLRDFLPWRFFGNDSMKWCDDLSHPYFVNFLGIRRLAAVAEELGVEKLVRLTGLTVGLPVYNPVAVLFNLLLSLTGKWHSMAEQSLHASSLDYTVLRPGGLSDDTRASFPPGDVALQLEVVGEDGSGHPSTEGEGRGSRKEAVVTPPARIGRADLASLCVACAATGPSAASGRKASRRTLACRWVGGALEPVSQGQAADGSLTWEEELAKLSEPRCRDESPTSPTRRVVQRSRPYATAVAVAVLLLTAAILKAAALLKLFTEVAFGILAKKSF